MYKERVTLDGRQGGVAGATLDGRQGVVAGATLDGRQREVAGATLDGRQGGVALNSGFQRDLISPFFPRGAVCVELLS